MHLAQRPALWAAPVLCLVLWTAFHRTARAEFPRPSENIAFHKTYRLDPAPDYQFCTDPDDIRQLTDGQYTSGYFWTQKSTVGWNTARPAIVTIDLGQDEPIRGVSFNTAAGVAGVHWPQSIFLLISDDGKSYREVGDLVTLSARNGQPPRTGYAVHRFWTDQLRTHGRYVSLVISSPGYAFVDEIEVYRGDPAWLKQPVPGDVFLDPRAYFRTTLVRQAIFRRLRDDCRLVQELLEKAKAPAQFKEHLLTELTAVETEMPHKIPYQFGVDFRAVLPLNTLHQRVFRVQAALWRATGAPRLRVWQNCLWDLLPQVHARPPELKPPLSVTMMSNEYRAGAFNLDNATTEDLTLNLHILGLPGGIDPNWITVHEVQWTDTMSGQPVAAALPEAKRDEDGYRIQVHSGLTRQVWLCFHPRTLVPGDHQGRIVLKGPGVAIEVPLILHLAPLRFPDQPTLHLGGWDYTDAEQQYGINPANRADVLAHLREHFVDSPWATAAVVPHGKHQADGSMTVPPDTVRFDEWLRRWPGARQYCIFASVGTSFDAFPMGTAPFDRAVQAWVRFWAQHAQRRGLQAEQLTLLLVDEPSQPEQDRTILAWAKPIRTAGAGVRIWEDTVHEDPAHADQMMLASCDILCPNRPMFLANQKYRDYYVNRRPLATELAFYSCSGPVRLLDPYAYHRLQAWSCFQYGARSSFYWAFGDTGGGSCWNEYAAPGPAFVPFFLEADSVTPGKHMEGIREGVEDYQYLVMLRQRVAEAEKEGRGGPVVEKARSALSTATARVCSPAEKGELTWTTERDRTVADQVRLQLLAVLEALDSDKSK